MSLLLNPPYKYILYFGIYQNLSRVKCKRSRSNTWALLHLFDNDGIPESLQANKDIDPRFCLLMKNEIHIGKLIREKMEEEGRKTIWLARKLSCDRSNIYKIYGKPNMDLTQLLHISRILNHDFFNDISVAFNKNINA